MPLVYRPRVESLPPMQYNVHQRCAAYDGVESGQIHTQIPVVALSCVQSPHKSIITPVSELTDLLAASWPKLPPVMSQITRWQASISNQNVKKFSIKSSSPVLYRFLEQVNWREKTHKFLVRSLGSSMLDHWMGHLTLLIFENACAVWNIVLSSILIFRKFSQLLDFIYILHTILVIIEFIFSLLLTGFGNKKFCTSSDFSDFHPLVVRSPKNGRLVYMQCKG